MEDTSNIVIQSPYSSTDQSITATLGIIISSLTIINFQINRFVSLNGY